MNGRTLFDDGIEARDTWSEKLGACLAVAVRALLCSLRDGSCDYSRNAAHSVYCRSDHYEYARYGIPIVFFTTGLHEDYHQVTDEVQYIDVAHLARVDRLVFDVAMQEANLDHRLVTAAMTGETTT